MKPLPLARALDEFALTAALLFAVVTVVRWLRDPGSPLYIGGLQAALAVIGPLSGLILYGLILSPPGRRSGGHLNPAVTLGLWLMDVFPGASVLPYTIGQLAGSAAGTALAWAVWGSGVSSPAVHFTALRPAPNWGSAAVFLAEAGCLIVLVVLVGFFLAYPAYHRWLPQAIGGALAVFIVVLGPLSGASANPARQFGPALLSGHTAYLWIYLLAPEVGAVFGAAVHHLLYRRLQTKAPLTYKLAAASASAKGASASAKEVNPS